MDRPLSKLETKLLSALLNSRTAPDAARKAGCHVSTVYRKVKEPVFLNALKAASDSIIEHAIVSVRKITGEAIDVLHKVLKDEEAPIRDRLLAARTILETSLRTFYEDRGISPVIDNRSFDIKVLLASPETRKALDMLSHALESGQKQQENAPQPHP